MAATNEQHQNFSGKSYGYYGYVDYTAENGVITVTNIYLRQDNTAHSYGAYYNSTQTMTVNVGNKSENVTIYGTKNQTSWFSIWSGSIIGTGSGGATISFTVPRAKSSAPYSLTYSWTIDAPPSSVTVNSVGVNDRIATVSASVNGIYTSIQYSKDGSNWQSSNQFTGLKHNTSYNFYARAKNNTSGWTTSSKYTKEIPGSAPIIGDITLTIGDTTCTFPTSGEGIIYDDTNYASSEIKYRKRGTSGWTTKSGYELYNLDTATTYEYQYTITDSAGKVSNTVTGTFSTTGQAKASLKINGTWKKGRVFFKKNGEWVVTKKIFTKINGSWTETKN